MKTLLAIFFASLMGGIASAAPLKIGIVDMWRIYTEYHRTRTNENELEKDKADARAEYDKRMVKFTALRKQWDEKDAVARGANNPAARQKAEKEAQQVSMEMHSLSKDIQELLRRRQRMIEDKLMRMRKEILADLHKHVAEKSKTDNYDLVFDKSGKSPTDVPFLLFSRSAIDFTDDLLKIVNKDAPPPGAAAAEPKKDSAAAVPVKKENK